MEIKPNAKQEQLIAAAFSGKYRVILYGGGIRSSKSFGKYIVACMAIYKYPGIRIFDLRQDYPTIRTNNYPVWEKFSSISVKNDRRSDPTNPKIIFPNNSELIFFGANYDHDKALTRLKFEANWIMNDELDEMEEVVFDRCLTRLSSYDIPSKKNPHGLFIGTCNPSHGWVKKRFYDKWKEGTLPDDWLYIPATVHDNVDFLQSNPGYIERMRETLSRYEFEVFINGDWEYQLKTGGEFLRSFDIERHIGKVKFNPTQPVHISIDNNRLPYIAVSFWQFDINGQKTTIKQYDELPCRDPDNTAMNAGIKVGQKLKFEGLTNVCYLYGDATTQAGNTIDQNKRSFLDLFYESLSKYVTVTKRIPSTNPPVAGSGEFINYILEGKIPELEIIIDEKCKESINDYIHCITDVNGNILKKKTTDAKTGASYEKEGHLLDDFRYIVMTAFATNYSNFKRRFDPNEKYYSMQQDIKPRSY